MYFTLESVESKVSKCQALYFIVTCSSHQAGNISPSLIKLSKDCWHGAELKLASTSRKTSLINN